MSDWTIKRGSDTEPVTDETVIAGLEELRDEIADGIYPLNDSDDLSLEAAFKAFDQTTNQ